MRRELVGAGAGGVAVLALFFAFLLRPVGAQIAETRGQIELARNEEQNLRLQLRQLEEARRREPEVAAQLAKFDLLLPRTQDLPAFIRQVQEAADLSGINLTSIAPSPPSPIAAAPNVDPVVSRSGVFSMNVVLNVSGGFFRMRSFFQRLEALQRVVLVSGVSLTPAINPETGVTELQSTMTLQMFVVNPSAPPAGSGGSTPTPAPSPSPSPTPTSGGGGAGGPATPTSSPSP